MKKKRLQAENKKRIKVQSIASRKCLWAFRMFIIAVFMSLFFGFLSQTLLSKMGALIAIIGIIFFIFVSVFFDMIGIAVASANIETFRSWAKEKKIGADIGIKLCENSEKVCSFCADVVGDICSTLCGAGGACIVVALTNDINNANIVMLVSISTSALIAGITIFFKAIMKERALKNSNRIILNLAKFLNKFLNF